MHRGNVDPGVSELPRGNELSRDHEHEQALNGTFSKGKEIVEDN